MKYKSFLVLFIGCVSSQVRKVPYLARGGIDLHGICLGKVMRHRVNLPPNLPPVMKSRPLCQIRYLDQSPTIVIMHGSPEPLNLGFHLHTHSHVISRNPTPFETAMHKKA